MREPGAPPRVVGGVRLTRSPAFSFHVLKLTSALALRESLAPPVCGVLVALARSPCLRASQPRLLLVELPQQDVVAGGGGPISNEELWSALQLPTYAEEAGPVQLRVLPRTLVHTDSARAYFNLGWREAELPPRHVDQAANAAETPAQQAARWAAEEAAGLRAPIDEDSLPLVILAERLRAPPRPPEARSLPEWRARYAPFQLAHAAVCHTAKKGGRKRQFVARRRVPLPDGQVIWAKGGTQSIDGHWALLKRHVSRSAINTGRLGQLRDLVWCHQWRHWAGPGVCKFSLLGAALRQSRLREAMQSRANGSADLIEVARAVRMDLRKRQRAAAAAARPAQRAKTARASDLAIEDAPLAQPPEPAAALPVQGELAPPGALHVGLVEPAAAPPAGAAARRRLRPLRPDVGGGPQQAQLAAEGAGGPAFAEPGPSQAGGTPRAKRAGRPKSRRGQHCLPPYRRSTLLGQLPGRSV